MPIDVYISQDLEPSIHHEFPAFSELGHNGYYWFLYPLFKDLQELTGQMIDLYDDAHFEGEKILALLDTIHRAQRLVEEQPSEWQVVIGWTRGTEIYDPVSKERFVTLLAEFEKIAKRATEMNHYLVFVGD